MFSNTAAAIAGATSHANVASAAASSDTDVTSALTAVPADRGKIAYDPEFVSCHGEKLISATYGTPLEGPHFSAHRTGKSPDMIIMTGAVQ